MEQWRRWFARIPEEDKVTVQLRFVPHELTFVEVKGYETDLGKWKQFPYRLIILKKEEINNLKKELFDPIM